MITELHKVQAKGDQESELIYFVRLANECCDETLLTMSEPLMHLTAIDQLFMEFLPASGGIKPTVAGILLLNAHSSLRASVRLALSGQLLPVFMTLRGSVESALYGHAMVVNPSLKDIWLNRDKNKKSREACRSEFSAAKMFRCLENAHTKEFANQVRDMYDSTIDFGAHPNSRSMIASTNVEKAADGPSYLDFAYIHGDRSFELKQALTACAEVSLAVFFVFLLAHQKHPQVSDLNSRALELQNNLSRFVQSMGLIPPEG